ncbi:MAG: hypothetical protein JRI68_18950 [Deltaproteobacteria bacterium]|nr:hypothetical protein [Deltaproteobacteria bacterium]
MNPLVKGACAAAVLAALGGPTEVTSLPKAPAPSPAGEPTAALAAPLAERSDTGCRRHSLPLGPVPGDPMAGGPQGRLRCVPLPAADRATTDARSRRIALAPPTEHVLRTRAPRELIPRLPDRPEPFADYQLPVDPALSVTTPAAAGPAEPGDRLGIIIEAEPSAPVTLVDLEGSTGRPEVVLVGQLEGVTVVVRQRVEGPAGPRDYLVIFGNLARPGPSIVNGASLGPMAVIGTVSDEEADAQLYLEVRMERGTLDRPTEHLSQLVSSSVSVAVDPRNVLPLRK